MQRTKLFNTIIVGATVCLMSVTTFAQTHGVVDVKTLNMRQEASADSKAIGVLKEGDKVEILDRANDEWVQVLTQDKKEAFVAVKYIDIKEVEGKITANNVRLRKTASIESSNIVKQMYKGDTVDIEYSVGDWYKVTHRGQEGFVSKAYVESEMIGLVPSQKAGSTEEQKTEKPKEETNINKGQQIAADAIGFVGGRYVYGGNSLQTGVDCSGFVQQIMKRHGISVTRSSRTQYSTDGYHVSASQLQPGDLTFYGYNGAVSHVAIYIGNGQIVHANTSTTGILISDLYSTGKPYIGAKRVH